MHGSEDPVIQHIDQLGFFIAALNSPDPSLEGGCVTVSGPLKNKTNTFQVLA